MFRLEIKKKALQKLPRLNQKQKAKINETISLLKQDPIPFRKADVSKLKGYDNLYRVRVGDVRIVYEVFWAQRMILIHYIGPREKAYNQEF